jgi:Cu(I)/Ag(I) efflux system membrane protein CusA/SilA
MPVQNRLDMALTGIKTPVGMKIQGPSLEGIQETGARIQQILSGLPQVRSLFAERVSQGFYLNVEVNRPEAARYGLTVADIQEAVSSGIGGMNVTENVEGRERYPVNVRYERDFRDDVESLKREETDRQTRRFHAGARIQPETPLTAAILDTRGTTAGGVTKRSR